MRVTVLGIGLMGSGLATILLREGHQVTVWNRDPSKAEALEASGAAVAQSPAAAVKDADAVITTLFDADSVLSVVEAARESMGPSTVWLQSSTIGLDGAQRVAEVARSAGIRTLEVQLMGGKKLADDGTLVLLVSGSQDDAATIKPVLDTIGRRTLWVGPELGQASALKLVCNSWITSLTASVAQSITLAQAFGLDPELFFQAIEGGQSDTPYARVKGSQMISGSYKTSFKLAAGLKDVRLIRDATSARPINTALLDVLAELYTDANTRGLGDEDLAAVYEAFGGSM